MEYLTLPKGILVTSGDPPSSLDFRRNKMSAIDVQLIHIHDIKDAEAVFVAAGFPSVSSEVAFIAWRFAFWVERILLDILRTIRKSNPSDEGPKNAVRYYSLVNNGVFFIPDPRERISVLYDAYTNHPRLALGCAAELAGKTFDAEAADPNNRFMWDAIYKGKHNLLQASMYVEHRARLALLKCAVDYICGVQSGEIVEPTLKELAEDLSLPNILGLPATFRSGLKWLEQRPSFLLYPRFWQTFLWTWGGFILKDRQDEEFATLSQETGVPVDEIPEALRSFDELFPIGDGWFREQKGTDFKLLIMMPVQFKGLGAFHRLQLYQVEKYGDLGYKNYTGHDLSKWNNAGYKLLS
ncbi:MAG: hypothetical protein IIC83_04365 [Chloroflexi bacterium]|nr:hypothetical protein [Chloroflexota bacterium]